MYLYTMIDIATNELVTIYGLDFLVCLWLRNKRNAPIIANAAMNTNQKMPPKSAPE